MKVYSFGDSWAAGWGLNKKQKRIGDWIADELNTKHINYGESGSSLGQILWDFQRFATRLNSGDLVIVIIPPDIRWYSDHPGGQFKSIFLGMKEFDRFLKDKTPLWFKYHHSLFLYTIYSLSEKYNFKLLMQHNYGDLELTKEFENLIPNNLFIDKEKSLTELLGSEDWKDNYKVHLKQDGPPSYILGEYFLPEDTHPNEEGHQKIAEFFLEKYNEVYK